MREFTHEERMAAALVVSEHVAPGPALKISTWMLVGESWAQGELVYCVSNQYAIQLQCELTLARETLMEVSDDILDIVRKPQTLKEVIFFASDKIQAVMDKNLAAGLRQLADALDAGTIDGKCIDCQGHGFGPKYDERAHLMLRIDLAAPIRNLRL